MANRPLNTVLHHLRKVTGLRAGADLADGELLERFVSRREEAAFEALLQRHGPMVQAVCQRILGQVQDVEDAFQATFLVLVRKAASVDKRESVGSWLHGVALRTSLRVRTDLARRRELERRVLPKPIHELEPEVVWRELRPLLDEELGRLPRKYRAPFVLCYLEGKTYEEAAEHLGCPKGTVSTRLTKARDLLRTRLVGRGLALSAGLLGAGLTQGTAPATVPASVVVATVKAAAQVAAGDAGAGAVSARSAMLTEGVLKAMFMTKVKTTTAIALVVALAGAGVGLLAMGGAFFPRPLPAARAEQPAEARKDEPAPHALVFIANDQPAVLPQPGQRAATESEYDAFRRTQAAVVKSRLVLQAALKQPAVADLRVVRQQADPLAWLEMGLQVDVPAGMEVLRISFSGGTPHDQVALINAVAHAYLDQAIGRDHAAQRERLSRLQDLVAKYDAQISEKRALARKLAMATGAREEGKPSWQEKLLLEDLRDLKRELRRIKLARVAAQVRLAKYKEAGADFQGTARKLEEEVLVLTQQEKTLGEDLKQLLKEAGEQNASSVEVESFRRELAAVEDMARRLSAEVEALNADFRGA
jgi:RNA polymerase sigma factor (sigma-70 family)